ncbi:MATE family efflux transporter [Roseburia sp. 1XD42-69]|uniref:MATE family efflux transporter n=1 Tax=Roseburia sp. 1XD42-69 TaxID=2320088 RepID=UPI000EA39C2D|nr:MATE family efflux transporter [Roseburia sp. 1XD42-69]RKJ64530.1 MATE family efflux transporter [Roseburia sp. 1XD42-69]
MKKEDSQYRKMTEEPVPKLVAALAVPTVVSMLITSIYNVVDTYFVAKLGTAASGAIGIVFSIMAMIQAVGFTLGMGAGSTISRLLGKKKEEEAKKVASSALAASVISGIILAILAIAFLEKLMVFLGASETILPYALSYARIILYACPVMMASFVLNNLLRAEAKTRYSMIGIGVGGILNVALDPLFIFYFQMGIKGAALATALGQAVGFFVLLSFYLLKKTELSFSLKKIARELSIYKVFVLNGMPSFFRQGLASAAAIALNRTAAANGDAAVAAMSIVGKIFMVVFCTLIGFGQGFQPVAGYNYGAKMPERVKLACKFTLVTGTFGMAAMGFAVFFLAPWLMEWFGTGEKEVAEIGVPALRMQSAAMPFMPLGIVCNMVFQAVGKSGISTFLAACRQGVFFLPAIFLFPKFFGIIGIELAQPIADVATFFVCVPFYIHFYKKMGR